MSIILCPDCSSNVSDTAIDCPVCGCNIQAVKKRKSTKNKFIFILVVGIIIWAVLDSNQNSESINNSSYTNEYTLEGENVETTIEEEVIKDSDSEVEFLNIQSQNLNVKKATEELFKQYAPKIEKSNDALIDTKIILTGDLNYDGQDDALVWFLLTPASGGNMIVDTQMAIYLNCGSGMEVVAGYNPVKTFRLVDIMENIIHLVESEYAEDDLPNKPSIENDRYYKLIGNKLVETRMQ